MKSIHEANEFLKMNNNSFTLDINKYADIIDFDNTKERLILLIIHLSKYI